MKQSIADFLEFKHENIPFIIKDGVYLVAVKPICQAIGIDYKDQYRKIKNSFLFGPEWVISPMQVPGDQLRKYGCLPEKFIYGWLASINSDNNKLLEYQRECIEILDAHFNGTITKRKRLIYDKAKLRHDQAQLIESLKDNKDFNKLEELRKQSIKIGQQLRAINEADANQYEMHFN